MPGTRSRLTKQLQGSQTAQKSRLPTGETRLRDRAEQTGPTVLTSIRAAFSRRRRCSVFFSAEAGRAAVGEASARAARSPPAPGPSSWPSPGSPSPSDSSSSPWHISWKADSWGEGAGQAHGGERAVGGARGPGSPAWPPAPRPAGPAAAPAALLPSAAAAPPRGPPGAASGRGRGRR